MGDVNPIRTLRDYSKPSHEGYMNTIELPIGNNVDPSPHGRILLLISLLNSFHREGQQNSAMISLCSNNIKENLSQKHGLVSRTYSKKSLIMASTFGSKDFAKPVKAISSPQDVPSTSDRRLIKLENQVQRLMEENIDPMKPTQVNKITSSCEIYSGPHGTQYYMGNPEQAFVEYASSCIDEAGGKWYTFKPEQNNFGDTYNLSWKSHPNLRNDKERGIEWLDFEEPLDLVDTRNMSYVMDFTIMENIETNTDPSLSYVVFGRLFACLAINRKHGLMTFTDGTKEITFKTSYKDPERSEFSSEGHDLLSSRIILSEDNYDRGCRKPSDLEDGFYRDTNKLGPEYITGMDDEGEVT
ncbi:hypothetical protein Tco_1175698 [Tanacetum coccineum]